MDSRFRPGKGSGWVHQILLLAFILLGVAAGGSAKTAAAQTSSARGPLNTAQSFAFADLDGDAALDSADVWSTTSSSEAGEYWLELQLSSVGRRSIPLVGPAGGLVIEARDINGDHAPDLILATAWFKQPVAVFLNDGHGSFSRVEPAKFPAAFNSGTGVWSDNASFGAHNFALPNQYRGAVSPGAERLRVLPSPADAFRDVTSLNPSELALLSHDGRAPPSRLILS
jgi:hypothetical protein